MNVVIPKLWEKSLTPGRTALYLAIGLFTEEEATLEQAAQTAGLSQSAFMRELGRRKIPLHYGSTELAEDLITIESLLPPGS